MADTFRTFFDCIDHYAHETPNAVALIDAQRGMSLTYSELRLRVMLLAGKLAARGIGPDRPVVVCMAPGVSLIETMLAAARTGAPCLPYMSPRNAEAALDVARAALRPALFVFSDDIYGAGFSSRGGEVWVSHEDIEKQVETAHAAFEPEGSSTLYINETSGSSGTPKLVPASHRSILANTRACVTTLGMTGRDVHMCTFSSHAHELFARALYTGGRAVLLRDRVSDNPQAIIDVLARHRVTCLMSNATAYEVLCAMLRRRPSGLLLRVAESGGMPSAASLASKVREKLGAQLLPVWGSTETGGVAIASVDGPAGSVGWPLPGYRVEIVDEQGKPVRPGEYGELVVSGEGVADAYVGGCDAERLHEGKFFTGDIARAGEDGAIFIRGRLTNEFKVAGVRVCAEEVETALCASPLVLEAAVLPAPHPVFGHVPAALLRVEPGNYRHGRPDDRRYVREIIGEVAARLNDPGLELPRYFKLTTEVLPRTAAGKLDRRVVRQMYFEEPPRPSRVRIPPLKTVRLVGSSLKSEVFRRLLLAHPMGVLRVLRRLRQGDRGR